MDSNLKPLAIVTGASTGIGYELAKCCANRGFDLLIVADEPQIFDVKEKLEQSGTAVEAVQADLARLDGVDTLWHALAEMIGLWMHCLPMQGLA